MIIRRCIMFIRLPSWQIPDQWELIKSCVARVDEVQPGEVPMYRNDLLCALLGNMSQCWLRLDEDRRAVSLIITSITANRRTGERTIEINCVFSWQGATNETRDAGKSTGCLK
jgi:hypothetical protein